jgi:hypothetical protein
MYVIKASGKREEFKPNKIIGTLMRAGASRQLANEISVKVGKKVRDGTTTRSILDMALKLLKNKDPIIHARYDLKRAVMSLGPTGFPFEKYFAEILKHHGYEVIVGQIYKGKLISHEIDVYAKKDKKYMVELKYHNSPGIYTDVKVSLYVHSRFLDLKEKFDQPWLATNTRLSHSAKKYAEGVGTKITSWEYPKKESLQCLIEDKKLYPVTILKSIDDSTKHKFSDAGIVLAIDLAKYTIKDLKKKTGIPENILVKILEEAKGICCIDVV